MAVASWGVVLVLGLLGAKAKENLVVKVTPGLEATAAAEGHLAWSEAMKTYACENGRLVECYELTKRVATQTAIARKLEHKEERRATHCQLEHALTSGYQQAAKAMHLNYRQLATGEGKGPPAEDIEKLASDLDSLALISKEHFEAKGCTGGSLGPPLSSKDITLKHIQMTPVLQGMVDAGAEEEAANREKDLLCGEKDEERRTEGCAAAKRAVGRAKALLDRAYEVDPFKRGSMCESHFVAVGSRVQGARLLRKKAQELFADKPDNVYTPLIARAEDAAAFFKKDFDAEGCTTEEALVASVKPPAPPAPKVKAAESKEVTVTPVLLRLVQLKTQQVSLNEYKDASCTHDAFSENCQSLTTHLADAKRAYDEAFHAYAETGALTDCQSQWVQLNAYVQAAQGAREQMKQLSLSDDSFAKALDRGRDFYAAHFFSAGCQPPGTTAPVAGADSVPTFLQPRAPAKSWEASFARVYTSSCLTGVSIRYGNKRTPAQLKYACECITWNLQDRFSQGELIETLHTTPKVIQDATDTISTDCKKNRPAELGPDPG
jgi:hypothetical protein